VHEITHAYIFNKLTDKEKCFDEKIFIENSFAEESEIKGGIPFEYFDNKKFVGNLKYYNSHDLLFPHLTYKRFNELTAYTVEFVTTFKNIKEKKFPVLNIPTNKEEVFSDALVDPNIVLRQDEIKEENEKIKDEKSFVKKILRDIGSPLLGKYQLYLKISEEDLSKRLKFKSKVLGCLNKKYRYEDPSYINRVYVNELLEKRNIKKCFKEVGKQLFPDLIK